MKTELTQEQLQNTIETIKQMKALIAQKGSKEAVVAYFMEETGLPKEECETAFQFYDNIKLV